MITQGVTVLRYGGSMVNNDGYRWKHMIGPRDRRPPYAGTWYRWSSNGWGILDFMDFCEAAGFEYIPDFNMGETPDDMADFIDYAAAGADSEWGRRRIAAGRREPYHLKTIELGNEERVDENYAAAFERSRQPCGRSIRRSSSWLATSRTTTRSPTHRTLAARRRESRRSRRIGQFFASRTLWQRSLVRRPCLDRRPRPLGLAHRAAVVHRRDSENRRRRKHKVVVFELNSNNHAMQRALGNALALNSIERDGWLPICTSANGLQPEGQNDNGWDQGLIFLNPGKVWLQPPGYAAQMASANYLPQLVECEVTGAGGKLDVNAKRSADGRALVLQAVNTSGEPIVSRVRLAGFTAQKSQARVTELAGPLGAVNTAEQPDAIIPQQRDWKHALEPRGGHLYLPAVVVHDHPD